MKILSREKYYCLLAFIELIDKYENILKDIEKLGLSITEERDKNNQMNWGGITSDILWQHIDIDEGLSKLGWEVQKQKVFVKKKFNKKKEEIIPKKIIIDESEDILEDLMSREG